MHLFFDGIFHAKLDSWLDMGLTTYSLIYQWRIIYHVISWSKIPIGVQGLRLTSNMLYYITIMLTHIIIGIIAGQFLSQDQNNK